MPLHVNLYHEVQAQERARQRDPLRLGMLGLLVIAIGFVVNYFVVMEQAHTVGEQYAALAAQYAALDAKATAAKARQAELTDEITASDTMRKAVESRFYWAPVLDQILKTVPRTVQLTHVGADAPSLAGGSSLLSITGISSAMEPRKEAEALRTMLAARLGAQFKTVTSVFKNLDDSDQIVMLDGKRLPTANFTIDFQLTAKDPSFPPIPLPRAKQESPPHNETQPRTNQEDRARIAAPRSAALRILYLPSRPLAAGSEECRHRHRQYHPRHLRGQAADR